MKKIYFFIIIPLISSCVQVRGIGDDYKYLTNNEKNMIKAYDNTISPTRKNVYKVNATEILNEVKKYPKAIVYVFTVGCPSDTCLPLNIYEEYAKKHGYKVFFVLTSYKDLGDALKEPISEPLFVIDGNYYGKKFLRKYVSFFENELRGLDKNMKRTTYESLHFYENGLYKNSYYYLPK